MNLIFQVAAGILSFWLAIKFVPGVEFSGETKYLLLVGLVLGLINFFIKPILNLITLPLRTVTFGLFGLVINMVIIWVVDIIFPELIISGLVPLFWTTLIIWGVSIFFGLYNQKKKRMVIEE
jgi:putative membrane protein